MDRVKRIWYLSPMRAAKFEICHHGLLEYTNSLDGAHIIDASARNQDNYINNKCKGSVIF